MKIGKLLKGIESFQRELKSDSHGRFMSWEHCYGMFHRARETARDGHLPDYQMLSLHLAFYLASWGMYGAISNTLITKILLGTLGCVPAYDRYFCDGLGKLNLQKAFSGKSVLLGLVGGMGSQSGLGWT